MEYILFIATDPDAEPYVEAEDNIAEWVANLDGLGRRLQGDRLRPVEEARTVRVRAGERIVTDGPFTESKEWIAGYDLIEATDLDEAIAIAAAHPMARFGRIEVRATWPFDLAEDRP
ncbi:YciI family protein [Sanguibacter sp. 25GB23B1]|uniref:YciI family protein n=1 Tax=unclassified Sanguibacter TaxID=2645534 RepID=UPI0032AF6FD1